MSVRVMRSLLVSLRLSTGCANPFPGTWYHKEIVLSGGDQVWGGGVDMIVLCQCFT